MSVRLPTFGKPTRATSAMSFSSSFSQRSSPCSPCSANVGARRWLDRNLALPRPPRPPAAASQRSPWLTQVGEQLAGVQVVHDGALGHVTSSDSPRRPCLSLPLPCTPLSARRCGWSRKASSDETLRSATSQTSPPLPPSPPLGPPNRPGLRDGTTRSRRRRRRRARSVGTRRRTATLRSRLAPPTRRHLRIVVPMAIARSRTWPRTRRAVGRHDGRARRRRRRRRPCRLVGRHGSATPSCGTREPVRNMRPRAGQHATRHGRRRPGGRGGARPVAHLLRARPRPHPARQRRSAAWPARPRCSSSPTTTSAPGSPTPSRSPRSPRSIAEALGLNVRAHRGDRPRPRLRPRPRRPRQRGRPHRRTSTAASTTPSGAPTSPSPPLNLCAETLDGIRNHSWSRPAPMHPRGRGRVTGPTASPTSATTSRTPSPPASSPPTCCPPSSREPLRRDRSRAAGRVHLGDDRRHGGTGRIGMAARIAEALAAFRQFNYEHVYLRPASAAPGGRRDLAAAGPGRALRRPAAGHPPPDRDHRMGERADYVDVGGSEARRATVADVVGRPTLRLPAGRSPSCRGSREAPRGIGVSGV